MPSPFGGFGFVFDFGGVGGGGVGGSTGRPVSVGDQERSASVTTLSTSSYPSRCTRSLVSPATGTTSGVTPSFVVPSHTSAPGGVLVTWTGVGATAGGTAPAPGASGITASQAGS